MRKIGQLRTAQQPVAFCMIGKRITRILRRGVRVGLAWALIPLIAWGSIPTLHCACENCQCGSTCSFASECGAQAGHVPASEKTPCCGCCRGGHCSCPGGCCCCKAKQLAAKGQSCPQSHGKDVNSFKAPGCRTSITTSTAIRTNLTVVDNAHSLAMDRLSTTYGTQATVSHERAFVLNTGPPVDLVMTYQRLLI